MPRNTAAYSPLAPIYLDFSARLSPPAWRLRGSFWTGSSYLGPPTEIGTCPSAIFILATSVASVVECFNSMNDALAVRLTLPGRRPISYTYLIVWYLVLGNPRSTACWLSTRPFLYPGNDYRLRAIDGWFLCRRAECQQCAASPEAAMTHLECFELFTKSYIRVDALDRLWRASSWRKPWRQAPAIVLPEIPNATLGAITKVANRYGLPELPKMPPEIRQMIQDYSQPSLFWRLVAALDLAAHFDAVPSSKSFSSVPVRQIAGWARGGAPIVQSQALDHLPIVSLTIDSRGIRKLERLPAGEPQYSSKRFDSIVFIIEDEGRFDGAAASFQVSQLFPFQPLIELANDDKDGQIRFELPEGHSGFHIWDTPNPPPQPPRDPRQALQIWNTSPNVPTRFCTINLSSITGLTFFFAYGSFRAIHAHTDTAPYATIPPECSSRLARDAMTWNYVPIPANDRVLAIGLKGASPIDLSNIYRLLVWHRLCCVRAALLCSPFVY